MCSRTCVSEPGVDLWRGAAERGRGSTQVEPDSEALKEGVQQAKDAINAAKARYNEYWGKSADAQ